MRETFREILSPLLLDDGVAFVGIYRVDGVAIFAGIKRRGVLNILDWLEEQVKLLLNYIESSTFEDLEVKISNYRLFLQPLSRSLVLAVLASETASLYKLRIDISTVRRRFGEHG
ncbi:MAG: hypothetical protein ABWW66_02510 [Archaeoglobaceae archaeon]